MKQLFLVFFRISSIVVFTVCNSQNSIPTGGYYLGGQNPDGCYSIQSTSDGGYVLGGFSSSFGAGNNDVYIAKVDITNSLEWTKVVGGSGTDECYDLKQTNDGGYVAVGKTNSFGAGSYDVYILRFDNLGNLIWTKIIGGVNGDEGYSIQQTTDGGYVVAGTTSSYGAGSSDVYVIKLDSFGALQWTKTIGGNSSEVGRSINQTSDGGYVIAGYTFSFGAGGDDVYLIKLDNMGNNQWTKTIGGTFDDFGYSVKQTTDGGYIVCGTTNSYGSGSSQVYLMKLNSGGILQWTKTVGGGAIYDSNGYSVQQTSDNGYIIAGSKMNNNSGNLNVYVVKLDSLSNLMWANEIGCTIYDIGRSIQETNDGGFLIGGSIGIPSKAYVLKLDAFGNTCCFQGSGGVVSNGGNINSGGIINSVLSIVNNGGNISNGGLLNTSCNYSAVQENNLKTTFIVYPNPTFGKFNLLFEMKDSLFEIIEIYNLLGEKIFQTEKNDANNLNLDISSLPNSVYFVKILNKNREIMFTQKLIKEE